MEEHMKNITQHAKLQILYTKQNCGYNHVPS